MSEAKTVSKANKKPVIVHENRHQTGIPETLKSMQIEMWPIDQPKQYPRNARRLSARSISTVAASIKEFGWQQPIVVDGAGVIIIGHTRQKAGKLLGLTECPVHVARDLKPAQVKALRIMENRSHEESTWDQALLGLELVDLKALECNLSLTGMERQEIITAFRAGLPEEEAGEKFPEETVHQERGLEFRVVVTCTDEAQQTELLDRFAAEGLKCRALIS